MAKKICCVCGKELSRFEFSGHPDRSHEDLWFCETCLNQRKRLLNIDDLDASKEAEAFFQEKISQCKDPAARVYMNSMLDMQKERMTNQVPELDAAGQMEEIVTAFPMTTGFEFDGYRIVDYKRVLSAEAVLGTGFVSEISAGIADIFGVASAAFEEKLEEARLSAEVKLVEKAGRVGANAIIGISINYTMFTGNIIGVVVNGTAVVREKRE